MSKLSRIEVITTGARRRWTAAEKRRIVAEGESAPRLVSATARRYGLSVSQLFGWRRLVREGRLGGDDSAAGFVPAVVVADSATPVAPASVSAQAGMVAGQGRMEIVLAGARRVIVDKGVDAAALARVISVLEGR
jgi:transposase